MGTQNNNWTGEEAPAMVAKDAQSRPNILVASDGESAAVLSDILTQDEFSVTRVQNGWATLDRLRHSPVDVAILDRKLGGVDGAEVCRQAKRDQDTRLVPVMLLLSDPGSREECLESIEAGADHLISMPIDVPVLIARLRSLTRMKRYSDDFETVSSVMTTLCAMIEARDRHSEGHCHRMANYAATLGRRIGLTGEQIHVLKRGGFLHDVGMLTIPDAVLLKPGTLDAKERALIESHPVIGESLIANLRSLQQVRLIVRHHHERRDGSGYPDGLRGEEIPLAAQIVGLVDVFEALTSPRPYQEPHSSEGALVILERQVKQGWHRRDLFDEFAFIIRGD